MSTENIGDKIVDGLHKIRYEVQSTMRKQFKGVKPFRQDPVDMNEIMDIYERMSGHPESMMAAIQKYGEEAVEQRIYELEKYKNGRTNKR
uniref:Uncharacterized protein n=1 Tax=viral metagenome TaxID=1070528 RepID=A0A6M3KT41_9ZZZZ